MIRGISTSFESRKYKTYADSVIQSAKLYVDSYKDDLFGHETTGCVLIRYSEMKAKKLIKDIELDDISCNSSDTFVKVGKDGGNYTYKAYLGC